MRRRREPRINVLRAVILVVGILSFIAFIVVLGWVGVTLTVWSWNMIIHGLFGGPAIDWPHAIAILVLLSIIGGYFRSR